MTNIKTIPKVVLLAGLWGLILIVGILFFSNPFVGNPISAVLANHAIKEYTAQNYSALELGLKKAHYNFKSKEYSALAESQISIDTHFYIYYRNGKVLRDNYEDVVLGKYNTLSRLEGEYSKLVIPLLAVIPGLENNRAMVQIEKQEYEKDSPDIILDMPFDKTLPFDVNLKVHAELVDNSLANISHMLEKAHQTMLENGCVFISYDVYAEGEDTLVMITNVTPLDIESGELEQRLQDALNYKKRDMEKELQPGDEKPAMDRKLTVFIEGGDIS